MQHTQYIVDQYDYYFDDPIIDDIPCPDCGETMNIKITPNGPDDLDRWAECTKCGSTWSE